MESKPSQSSSGTSLWRKLRPSLAHPSVSPWEWIACKALFAWIVLRSLPLDPIRWPSGKILLPTGGRIGFESQPDPSGLAQFMDFTWIGNPALQPVLWILCGLALVVYVATRWELPSLLPLLLVSIAGRTLINSQGFIHHGYQMLTLILLAQFIALAWGRIRSNDRSIDRSNAFAASQAAIAGCYVIAGISKIIRSGLGWFTDSHYLALDIVKTHRQAYYNALDPAELEGFETLVPLILEHDALARIGFGAGVVLELIAFAALFGRGYALFFGLALIAFHKITEWSMGLSFSVNQSLDWVFLIAPQFWLLLGAAALWRRMAATK